MRIDPLIRAYEREPSFAQVDIHDYATNLVDALLTKIEVGQTPEKLAENDHLMRCK